MQNNNNYGHPKGGYSQSMAAEDFMRNHSFDPKWVQEQADQAMVAFAEEAGKSMAENELTTSKIRSVYGEIKRIQMGTFNQGKSSFILLKPKMAYALGRDRNNQGLKLFKLIFDKCYDLVSDEKTFVNFCHFMEAILAYHKANAKKNY